MANIKNMYRISEIILRTIIVSLAQFEKDFNTPTKKLRDRDRDRLSQSQTRLNPRAPDAGKSTSKCIVHIAQVISQDIRWP